MTKLLKSIRYLTSSLKDESDVRIHEALAIMINVHEERRECTCGNRHEYSCSSCENLLCGDCDRGTHMDERSVCRDCKDAQECDLTR
jgi:hypothetical protein